ncbi:hypothetical protein AB0K43_23540 [Kitasatospora sp. NPDC049258]|uniref:hypothetical protein n=1 Tax=Kitasatospora sp. NPDC049258 TaxID=3155394 RepID=UPI00343F5F8B
MSDTRIERFGPARVLAGFALLLALVFGVSYGLGSVVGPVAPGLAPAGPGPGGDPADDGHGMTMGAPAPSEVAPQAAR